ncbi:MAG: carbohydrate-binding domain-containing protein [Eubacterium sp.]|nr:carbohydrate-binding domain-containing protein [Eubacterium sp.]
MRKKGAYLISTILIAAMLTGCGAADGTVSNNTNNTVVSAAETDDDILEDDYEEADEEESNDSEDTDTETDEGDSVSEDSDSGSEEGNASSETSQTSDDDEFTDRDVDYSYDESEAIEIILNKDSASSDGAGVTIDGSTVTISQEGIYVISGSLEDGQIIVDADDTAKVQLVLNGVDITCSYSAAIYVRNADKTFITLADGTENTLSDTGSAYTADGDENVDGVIYSKDDITFNGSGYLTIEAGYNHGIVGNDDVKFTGGTYSINATNKGVKANDSIRIKDGTYIINSGDDALHTSNYEEDGKGYIYIVGGSFQLAAGDDGIHAEKELIINDGTIDVSQSVEGLEGATIEINGGDISVNASDDGLNATGTSTSGSMDSVEMDFGDMKFGGGMMMDAVADAELTINGGTIYVNAGGDGLDSNGYLYINDGIVTVDGPTNDGNGALDTGYTAYVNGGSVILVGSSGMAESFSADSEQYSILYNFSNTLSEGTEIELIDESGNVVMSYTLNKTANSVLLSSPDIKEGTYTIKAGSTEDTITVTSISTSGGVAGGFGGGMGTPGGDMGGDMSGGFGGPSGDMGGGFGGPQ